MTMVGDIVKRQLESLEVAKVGPYDPEANAYFIPRAVPRPTISAGERYRMTLSDFAVGDETLAGNWNDGRHPPKEVDALVVGKVGNMACIDDGRSRWWVPATEIEELVRL